MSDSPEHYFTCPQCGSYYFGRDTADDGHGGIAVLKTVRCHGGWSADDPQIEVCHWRGEWPPTVSRPLSP